MPLEAKVLFGFASHLDLYDRVADDYYPTPEACTQAVVDFHRRRLPRRILEPCCGEGYISRVLELNGLEVTSSDLFDRGYGQPGVDYLKTPMRADCIITNPPFVVAFEMLQKAVKEAPLVVFLLKQTFWNASGRFNWYCANPPTYLHPMTWRPAFLEAERGTSPVMDMQWCVWAQGDHSARTVPFMKPARWPELGLIGALGRLDDALFGLQHALKR